MVIPQVVVAQVGSVLVQDSQSLLERLTPSPLVREEPEALQLEEVLTAAHLAIIRYLAP